MSDPPLPDLASPRRVHVANAGGAGMSAIATVLAQMGHHVTGHDPRSTSFLDALVDAGLDVSVGPEPPPLADDVELVAASTATPDDDPQLVEARARGVPVARRAALLGAIAKLRSTVAVAGTHGKTTTSGMLATALDAVGQDPSFIVGAVVTGLGVNARWGSADVFVVEADESDGTFLALGADTVIVTNVEADHLEHWGSLDALVSAFETFLAEAGGARVVCADDPIAAELGRRVGATSYGTEPDADYRLLEVDRSALGICCDVSVPTGEVVRVELAVPGLHNARNAVAALATCVELGLEPAAVADALAAYGGVERRFELRGEVAGVTFVDSYDHLPTEVVSALDAARQGGWRRIVCVFQPHRYSRTEALWRDFGPVFGAADVVVVTDVYSAGEPRREGVSGKLIVDAVLHHRPGARVAWMPRLDDVVSYLTRELRSGDLCLTLGAGDLTTVPDRVIEARS